MGVVLVLSVQKKIFFVCFNDTESCQDPGILCFCLLHGCVIAALLFSLGVCVCVTGGGAAHILLSCQFFCNQLFFLNQILPLLQHQIIPSLMVASQVNSELSRSPVQNSNLSFKFLFFRTTSPVSTGAVFLPRPSRVTSDFVSLSFFHFSGGFCH